MGSAEPSHGRSREDAPEPAALLPGPAPQGRVATIVALQRSAGNAAVTRMVSGDAAIWNAPRPPQPTAGDAAILARLTDTARVRSAMTPDRAAEDPPMHPADRAALDLDKPKPKHHATHKPQPAPAPAPEPAGPTPEQQLAELRAKVPDLAHEILDAATARLDPGKQVAAFQERAERRRLAEEQALNAALEGAPDAAAAGDILRPLLRQRIPALAKALEEEAIKELEWEPLGELGANQTPGFSAGNLIREVRGAIEGWGTNEKRLFAALEGHTPLQIAAMRKAYQKTYGDNMDEEVDDELSGSEAKRAKALLTGDPVAGAVATLRDAMDGAGTDEDTIMHTLRGRPAAERAKIIETYEKTYGRKLKADLDDEMGGYEYREAEALLAGDTVKADAMGLKNAMDGVGTDEPAIHAVYARIRDEVEHEAAEKGWKTAQLQAELKRRTGQLKTAYDSNFGSLEEDFDSELSGGELNLALAEQAGDQTGMDAAELQTEHLSAWTSDDKVNEVLKSQYTRAEREIMRDLSVDFQHQAAQLPREQRAAAWKALQERGRALAQVRAKHYIDELKGRYDATSLDGSTFDGVIRFEVSGYSQQEAHERIAAGGKLSDEKELKYAIFGPGTNEQTIREVLKGKSKAELDELSKAYKKLTGNDLMSDLKGDLSGRDEADMTFKLQTGDSTPEERAAYLDKRSHWELEEGTGLLGSLADDEEARVLSNTNAEAQAALAELRALPENDPRRPALEARLERWLGYGDKDIERHREELDSITETIATVGAITVGIAVTALTAGAAGVAVLAAYFGTTTITMAAAVGAVAAAGASMMIKQEMKGAAYGGEEIATDLALQTANAVVMVATAGVGEAAIQALARTPAFAVLGRAAEAGALGRLAVKGAGSGVEGLIQGLPGGMMGAILNEETWRSANPLGAILHAGGKGALQTAAMSAGIGAGMHGVGEAVHALRGAGEPAAVHESAPGESEPPAAGGEPEPNRGWKRSAGEDPELDRVLDELDEAGFEEEPTQIRQLPVERIPFKELWDGTIIDRDPPLTPTEAERIFENLLAESEGRNEAMILKHRRTGERIVIQGGPQNVNADAGAVAELLRNGGTYDDWVPVRHFHPVDATGTTPMRHRVPSGIGGDMSGVRETAIGTKQLHVEILDIATETGRQKLYFGYDPETHQWLVGRPGKTGSVKYEYFKSMREYHAWAARELGEPIAILGKGNPGEWDGGTGQPEPIGPPDPGRQSDVPPDEEPTGQWQRPDGGDGRTSEFDDEPTQDLELIGDEGPTQVWDVPAERLPESPLWEGTIIERDPPLTAAEADAIYERLLAETPGREATIWENPRTGERIVIQGGASHAGPSTEALHELFRNAGKRGLWTVVRHAHRVEAGGVTHPRNRFASTSDMYGARLTARHKHELHVEVLDIVTENGREQVHFGFDPVADRYLAARPGQGPLIFEPFATIADYEAWVRRQIDEPPAGGERTGWERNAESVDDDWNAPADWDPEHAPPELAELPEADESNTAARLLERYPTELHVRQAVMNELLTLGHGSDPHNLPAPLKKALQALELLKDKPGNRRVAELLPIVLAGLRDPALYAEVLIDAWRAMRADAAGSRDINRALLRLAAKDKARFQVIPKERSIFAGNFYGVAASQPAHIIDLPFLGQDHGVLTHLIHDLVVNKGFEAAGVTMTSTSFRELLPGMEGDIDPMTDLPTDTPGSFTSTVGEVVWREVYDSEVAGEINDPASLGPIMRRLFGVQ